MAHPTRRREDGDEHVERPFVGAPELAVEGAGELDEVVAAVEDVDAPAVLAQRRHDLLGRGSLIRRGAPHTAARSALPASRSPVARPVGGDDGTVEEPHDVLGRDAAGPEDLGRFDGAVDDRALDADRCGATVEDRVARRVEPCAEVVDDVRGGGRADPSEAVRRRRRDPAAEAVEQLQRHRV